MNMNYSAIWLIHALFVGPLLVYMGIQKGNVPEQLYMVLLALGCVVIAYHGYKLLSLSMKANNKTNNLPELPDLPDLPDIPELPELSQ